MSLFQNAIGRNARKARLAALIVGAAACAFSPLSSRAQQQMALRGELSDDPSGAAIDGLATASTDANADDGTFGATTAQDKGSDAGGTDSFAPLPSTNGSSAGAAAAVGFGQQPFDTLDQTDQTDAGAKTKTAPKKDKKGAKQDASGASDDEAKSKLASKRMYGLRVLSIDADDDERNIRATAENKREQAIGNSLRPKYEENPYSPLGLRLGLFNVQTSVQTGLEGTTNADSSSDGKPALVSQTTLHLNAQSDWSRHSANINAYGIFSKSVAGQHLSQPIAGILSQVNLDISHDLVGKLKLGYAVAPETPETSPVTFEGTTEEPLTQTLTGTLGLEKALGALRFGVSGNVERNIYGNATLTSGGVLSQRDRDNTLVTGVVHVGYELSPSIIPYVEGEIGRRYYDLRLDDAGYERSANHLAARAGVTLDLTDKLSGDFSAGWVQEKPDDNRLTSISGPSVAADLKWSPIRGTIVSLKGTTQIEGSTTAGEPGDILYTSLLSVERQMRANLTGTAMLGVLWRNYSGISGHDFGWNAEADLTYWLNRYFGITGHIRHEQQMSTLPGRDYRAESVFIGLIAQQ